MTFRFFLIQERANGSPHTSSHQLSLMFRDKQLNATHQRKTKSCPKWNLAKKRPNWALFPVLGLSVLPLPLTYCVAECQCVSESNDETTEWIMNENDCKAQWKCLKGPKMTSEGSTSWAKRAISKNNPIIQKEQNILWEAGWYTDALLWHRTPDNDILQRSVNFCIWFPKLNLLQKQHFSSSEVSTWLSVSYGLSYLWKATKL